MEVQVGQGHVGDHAMGSEQKIAWMKLGLKYFFLVLFLSLIITYGWSVLTPPKWIRENNELVFTNYIVDWSRAKQLVADINKDFHGEVLIEIFCFGFYPLNKATIIIRSDNLIEREKALALIHERLD